MAGSSCGQRPARLDLGLLPGLAVCGTETFAKASDCFKIDWNANHSGNRLAAQASALYIGPGRWARLQLQRARAPREPAQNFGLPVGAFAGRREPGSSCACAFRRNPAPGKRVLAACARSASNVLFLREWDSHRCKCRFEAGECPLQENEDILSINRAWTWPDCS